MEFVTACLHVFVFVYGAIPNAVRYLLSTSSGVKAYVISETNHEFN